MAPRTLVTLSALALVASCQRPAAPAADAAEPALSGDAAKIAEAESAAPAVIAANATIMDWPATEGGEPRLLRTGTNGWTCFPSTPVAPGTEAQGEDPMCLDAPFQDWAQAWMARRSPRISSIGIAYMLQGDRGASNTDPFATGPTADNEWVVTGPHIMVVVPDLKQLEGFGHDPASGGPYVMWRGTPWAHLMVPVAGRAP
jgi:hypothetical protein